MKDKHLKDTIYVYVDGDVGEEFLVATDNPSDLSEGTLGVYKLVEKLNVRTVTEFRRPNTKKWFR